MAELSLTMCELQRRVNDFNESRNWLRQHSVESLSKAIAVESAELLELTLWEGFTPSLIKDIESEMADVSIYLLALANFLNIDLDSIILEKMAENKKRFLETEE